LLSGAQELAAAAPAVGAIAVVGAVAAFAPIAVVIGRVAAAAGVVAIAPVLVEIGLDVEAALAIVPPLRHGSSPWRSGQMGAALLKARVSTERTDRR